jgi:FixJ family two-component response regulator
MNAARDEILILDDEESYAEMLVGLLEEDGFRAEMMTSPTAAIERLRTKSFALVIADYKMPELNGAEFLAQLRDLHPGMPVVIVSGHMNTRELLSVANMGVTLVLEKPFDKNALVETVRRFVQPAEAHAVPQAHPEAARAAANPFPSDGLRSAHSSDVAREFLQTLWDAFRDKGGATLAVPIGGELELVIADIEQWLGLESPALRLSIALTQAPMKVDHPVLAVLDARYATDDMDESVARLRRFVPTGVPMLIVVRSDAPRPLGGLPLVAMPPLGGRMEDIAFYARNILERVGAEESLRPDAARLILNYNWPGNYYELMGALRRAVLASEMGPIDAACLATAIGEGHGAAPAEAALMTLERRLLAAQAEWFASRGIKDIASAAEASGVPMSRFDKGQPLASQPLLFP